MNAKGLDVDYLQAPADQTEALLLCGLINEDPRLREPIDDIPEEDYKDDEGPVPTPADESSEMSDEGRQVMGCDGSAYNHRDDRLRRAVYGAWLGHNAVVTLNESSLEPSKRYLVHN